MANRIEIGNSAYLPSSALEKELKGEGRWDLESQVWTLTTGAHELKAVPQMSVVLIDGAPFECPTPPVLREGELFLPEGLWNQGVARWTLPAPPGRIAPPALRLGTIILDAGHGGRDPGAIGRNGLREKSVTLDVALRLRDLLEQDGFRVVMTRDEDRFVSLPRRSAIANTEGGDLFVSIHANASRRRSISGYEVYYLSEATDDHARALEAAENVSLPTEVGESVPSEAEAIVWDLLYTEQRAESLELASSICQGLRRELPSQNRGVKSARFAVLKGTRMPSILIEVGFITHPAEEARFHAAAYRQRLAEGIRNGIRNFKAEHERQT